VGPVPGEAGSEYLERARKVVPVIEASADRIEQERRLPPAVVDALHEAGLFRLLLPRECGGAQVDPLTYLHVIEEVARADASTAWCLGQGSGCSISAVYLDAPVAREVFGDARAVLAWGPPRESRAVAVDGGYRITGTWHFASGCHHATWLGGLCPVVDGDGTPRRRADGRPEARTMLFPASSAAFTDMWQVTGLRGTGSDAYQVTDLFVPHAHSIVRDDPAERRHPAPLYRFPYESIFAGSFSTVALGIARRTLDGFIDLAQAKTPRGGRSTVRESAVVQMQVAQAEARLRSARLFLMTAIDEIWRAVQRTGVLTVDQRMTIRLAATSAIHQAKDVVDTVFQAAGAGAIFTSGGFDRRFRDMHSVTQQLQARLAHFETVGQFVLGLEPDTSWA
jgi:alkylation response protein AidB-like acyl-CoA dehydrogenase